MKRVSIQDKELYIYQNIIQDMLEGILVISMKGKVTAINPAGQSILGVEDSIIGKPFMFFLDDARNDPFNQIILDAVYEKTTSHNAVLDYYRESQIKRLFVNTSYLTQEGEKIGIIAVLNDVTELMELKDVMVAVEKIKMLNKQLEVRNNFIKKTFGRYLSDEIVNDILEQENGGMIGGEKKVVTILISDLRGFTAISETMLPQKLIIMLNHYLERMIDIVMQHQGTVLEFLGDAVIAVFGAPVESEQAAFRAACCAIQMQREMESINEFNRTHQYSELEMGIGIHTGEVIIGNIGSERRTKYDIIGKNVNLASRIESFAVGGQVLISEEVKKAISAPLVFAGQQQILAKGVKTPITVYELLGAGEYHLPQEEEVAETLNPPLCLEAAIVDGKQVRAERVAVEVMACGKKTAILKSAYSFPLYTNLKFICDGQEIFAKVMSHEGEEPLVHFTFGTLYKGERCKLQEQGVDND